MSCHLQILFIIPYLLAVVNCEERIPVDDEQQQQQPPQLKPIKVAVPDLPLNHYRFWLKNHPRAFQEFKQICSQNLSNLDHKLLQANLTFDDPDYLEKLDSLLAGICSDIDNVSKSCWGYENSCQNIYLMPECLGSHLGQAKNEQEQKITWFSQSDFGYILDRRRELSKFCSLDKHSTDLIKSSLECTKYFRTCRGDNLMIKFNSIPKDGGLIKQGKESTSVAEKGGVGGWNCDLQVKRIQEEDGQRGALESWFNELSNYTKLNHVPPGACDETIEKPAYIIKLDSSANLHNYLGSFLNLYATFHLNNRFSDDNQIIIWDNQLPRSKFDVMWKAFTRNRLLSIESFENKRVCFKKFVFTLLPRTKDGLLYNTKLIPGCSKSGLFDSFNKYTLHKLRISQDYNQSSKNYTTNELIRVTLFVRSTPYRKILNQDRLFSAIRKRSDQYVVQLIDFQKHDFLSQIKIAQNTDILIGIHDAGLAHTLFLPDWAVLYELYDCQEKSYHDLARLRGVSYVSPKKEDKVKFSTKLFLHEDLEDFDRLRTSNLLKYDKYWSYYINEDKFIEYFNVAVEKVKKNRLRYFPEQKVENKTKDKPNTSNNDINQKGYHHSEL